jgi:gentisate 1,2-dioxygenase
MSLAEVDATAMDSLRKRLAARSMYPLWDSLHALVPSQPNRHYRPFVWRYDEVRELLMEAGEIISAEQAERRVLVLENPDLPQSSSATPTIYAGVQLVLPDEVAPAHRHSQSALRFILEGEDAVTAVEGEEIFMRAGDLVLTPNWMWHDHANASGKPILWLDGLDIPLVRYLNAGFMEKSNATASPRTRLPGDGRARFGAGMAPAEWKPSTKASPKAHYPYSECRDALHTVAKSDTIDPFQGWRMRYVNPATGGSPLATFSCYLRLLPKGFASRPYRATDSRVFTAAEGKGVATIDGEPIAFGPRDVFVVPGWAKVIFEAAEETVLFEMSDRVVQEAFDLWREDRGASGLSA